MAIVLEVEAVAALLPAHEARLLIYLRKIYLPMSRVRIGLLTNFHATCLAGGLRRLVV